MNVKTQLYVNKKKPKPSLIEPIRNIKDSSKPRGGFWTSPLEKDNLSPYEKYENGALIKSNYKAWKIIPKKECNVKYIKSEKDLETLPEISYNSFSLDTYIDFEEFFGQGYDGLYISGDIAYLKSFSKSYNLRAWDFESILWSNLNWIDTIIPMEETSKRL